MMSNRYPNNKILIAIIIFVIVIILGLIITAKQESSHSEITDTSENSPTEWYVPNS